MQALSNLDLGYILSEDQGLDDPSSDMAKISLDFSHLVYLYSKLYLWLKRLIIYKLHFIKSQVGGDYD